MSVEVVAPFNVPEAEEVYMTEEENEKLEEIDEGNDIQVEGDDTDDEEADITCLQCGSDVIIDDVTHKCPVCKYQFKLTKHGLLDDGFVQDKVEYEDGAFDDDSEDEMEFSDEESSEYGSESEIDYCDSDEEYVPKH
jgi:hypothetical protein